MAKILISPGRYVQGAGELGRLGQYAKPFGRKALVLISTSGARRVGTRIADSFTEADLYCVFENFGGECCPEEIERLVELARAEGCDMIVGVGGGKILDTAKATAHFCGTPVLICPTIASTDAPCSALSVIYTSEGVFDRYLFLPRNPDLVLMDTEVIAASPARLTVSGMGDALATWYEARACAASDADTCAGGKTTQAALALARLCRDTLLAEGRRAKLALEAGACTEAVERVIEANTLLSGMGFESGGLAAAHAVHNGLTVLPGCHGMYHGEKVAFGTLTQLVLENAPDEEVDAVLDFCVDVGLPVTLAELGLTDVTDHMLLEVAEAACAPGETVHNMPFAVTPERLAAALRGADALGRARLARTAG